MITLDNGILRVEIAEPKESPNTTVRFDRAGFITEVVLNGERRFCASEPKNLSHPSSGGRGLCSEIQLDLSQETKMGERYPKFGVGLIRKETEDKYSFFGKYDIVDFDVAYKANDTEAGFYTAPKECNGYAVGFRKSISINGATLTVKYEAFNAGYKPVELTEYCHNFISIDGMALSPDYRLEFPNLAPIGNGPIAGRNGEEQNMIADGNALTFAKVDNGVSMAHLELEGMDEMLPFTWKLSNAGAKAAVVGEEFFKPAVAMVWSADHMVSPEIKNRVYIEPDGEAKWERRWTFIDEMK